VRSTTLFRQAARNGEIGELGEGSSVWLRLSTLMLQEHEDNLEPLLHCRTDKYYTQIGALTMTQRCIKTESDVSVWARPGSLLRLVAASLGWERFSTQCVSPEVRRILDIFY
jgi:hypothetical protein